VPPLSKNLTIPRKAAVPPRVWTTDGIDPEKLDGPGNELAVAMAADHHPNLPWWGRRHHENALVPESDNHRFSLIPEFAGIPDDGLPGGWSAPGAAEPRSRFANDVKETLSEKLQFSMAAQRRDFSAASNVARVMKYFQPSEAFGVREPFSVPHLNQVRTISSIIFGFLI